MDYSEDQSSFFFSEMNKRLKKRLEKKFGADFGNISREVPPEIEHRFLSHIEEFEERWEKAECRRIDDILGHPSFKHLEEIQGLAALETEIQRVLNLYAMHSINVDIIEEEEVSRQDFYRFLTEELPMHEDYFISIDGMTTNYIYEEFHPSDRLNARECVKWFLVSLVNRDIEEIRLHVSKAGPLFLTEQRQCDADTFIAEMLDTVKGISPAAEKQVIISSLIIDGPKGRVDASLQIGGAAAGQSVLLDYSFELVKGKHGGFEICACRNYTPGRNFEL